MKIRTTQLPLVSAVSATDTVQGIVGDEDVRIPVSALSVAAGEVTAIEVDADATGHTALTGGTVQAQLGQADAALAVLTADVAAIEEVPAGGADATVLAKASATDHDVEWATLTDIGAFPASSAGALASQDTVTALKEIVYSVPGELVAGAGTMRFYFTRDVTLTNVAVSVGTAPTGASVIVDANINGSSAFGVNPRPTIVAGAFTDLTSALDTTAVSAGSYLTIDIDQVGSTIAGSDLVVIVEFTEAIA